MAAILIVDDDKAILHLLSEVLGADGHQIVLASDGAEALDKIAGNNFDLVISDLHMKEINGIEVLKAAKKKDPYWEVLILTGYGSIKSAVKAMKLGAFEYLTKPIDVEEFRLKVRQGLEHRELRLEIEKQRRALKAHQEMIARDLKLAEQVQKSLVPPPVKNDKLEVEFVYRPIIGVGGDYADVYFDGNHLAYLTLVDVTGHGITAALLVNRVCSEVRKLVREKLSPKNILFHLNDFILESFPRTGMFLTIFSSMINLDSFQLTYAGSAHPAAILWDKRKNTFSRLDSQNQIIGFQQNPKDHFLEETISINSGDKVFLYTDGIVEIEDEQRNPLGFEGLLNLLQRYVQLSPKEISNSLVASINEFRHKPIRDDIYLMVAEIK